MNIDNYEIKSIESIKFYGRKIIEKNIPNSIEVTKHEFNTFIKNRSLRYERIRQRDFPIPLNTMINMVTMLQEEP